MTDRRDIYDPSFVRDVFDKCSRRYIAFSWLFSFGFTERWRRECVERLPQPPGDAPTGYDLMAGTGEVWPHLLRRFPDIGAITAIDISSGMHQRAMSRLHRHRAQRITFIEDDLLCSALPDASADFMVSTFGLKTFNREQQLKLAALIARVLRVGGSFALIEASDPKGWMLRPLYPLHLHGVLPLVERLLLQGAQDFTMIGTYLDRFGDAAFFADALRHQGLDVVYGKRFFGCASVVSGRRPA